MEGSLCRAIARSSTGRPPRRRQSEFDGASDIHRFTGARAALKRGAPMFDIGA
jgi:hypothetical protein